MRASTGEMPLESVIASQGSQEVLLSRVEQLYVGNHLNFVLIMMSRYTSSAKTSYHSEPVITVRTNIDTLWIALTVAQRLYIQRISHTIGTT